MSAPRETPAPSAAPLSTPARSAAPLSDPARSDLPPSAPERAIPQSALPQIWTPAGADLLLHGDNLAALAHLPDASMQLVYLDPPFNTGRTQQRRSTTSTRDPDGAYLGFQGTSYSRTVETLCRYDDTFLDYWGFLAPRLEQAHRVLRDDGTLYLHLDWREAHYAKVALDALFGRECFLNELIWAYDYGAKSRRRWPTKHDTILVYVKNPDTYYFDSDAVDREPYMAPGLVTPEKAARGKLPTDVWWHTIVTTNGREKTGYPTQKPLGDDAPQGRLGARPLRRQRHDSRRRPRPRPAQREHGRQPRGGAGHERPARDARHDAQRCAEHPVAGNGGRTPGALAATHVGPPTASVG